MAALEYAPNGVTIRATKPREFYKDNQVHTLDGTEYTVVLSKDELRSRIREEEDVSHLVTTFISNMCYIFYCDTPFNDDDVSRWDVSNVTDMSGMFSNTVFNGDVSRWDVSNVTNMECMFYNANSFNGDVSRWNISNVTNVEGMF